MAVGSARRGDAYCFVAIERTRSSSCITDLAVARTGIPTSSSKVCDGPRLRSGSKSQRMASSRTSRPLRVSLVIVWTSLNW